MGITAGGLALFATVLSAGATVASTRKTAQAAETTRKSEERARKVTNAVSRLENQKAIRRRIAQQRVETAEVTQGAEAAGVAGSSSLFASVGSLQTSAAADIGFARSRLAGSQGASNIRAAGAKKAGGQLASAAQFGAIASVSGLFTNAQNNRALGSVF